MTDRIEADGHVIKTNSKGRVRMPADQREKLLEELERSGISGRQFAAVVGVKYQTLAGWGPEATPGRSGESPLCRAAGVRHPLARSGSGRNFCLLPTNLAPALRRTLGGGGCQAFVNTPFEVRRTRTKPGV